MLLLRLLRPTVTLPGVPPERRQNDATPMAQLQQLTGMRTGVPPERRQSDATPMAQLPQPTGMRMGKPPAVKLRAHTDKHAVNRACGELSLKLVTVSGLNRQHNTSKAKGKKI